MADALVSAVGAGCTKLAVPSPVTKSVGLFSPFTLMRLPKAVPTAVGVKVTSKVIEPEDGTDKPDMLLTANMGLPDVILLMVPVVPPVLETVYVIVGVATPKQELPW